MSTSLHFQFQNPYKWKGILIKPDCRSAVTNHYLCSPRTFRFKNVPSIMKNNFVSGTETMNTRGLTRAVEHNTVMNEKQNKNEIE